MATHCLKNATHFTVREINRLERPIAVLDVAVNDPCLCFRVGVQPRAGLDIVTELQESNLPRITYAGITYAGIA